MLDKAFAKFQELTRDSFETLKNEKLRPQYNLDGLRLLQLQALRERDLRELYRERAPYELLQNADDVAANKAAFIITEEGLAFVHDGRWFSVDNFGSLANGWSDKNPKECIGHKGLGFRSVLDITPAPHLVKIDAKEFFAAKFTYAINNGHILETLNRNKELKTDYDKMTKHGQRICPVMSIPGFAKKHNLGLASSLYDRILGGGYRSQFTTMFWFPQSDPEIPPNVMHELGISPVTSRTNGPATLVAFLEDEVSVLLPFLKSISSVHVYSDTKLLGSITIAGDGDRKGAIREISLLTRTQGKERTDSFFQMSFRQEIPHEIRRLPDTPLAIKELDKASVILSIKLEKGKPISDANSVFHVYFPTEEPTGAGFTVHGDFHVKPDRTRLMSSGYNEWLLRFAAKKAAEEFLTELLSRYEPKAVFSALAPEKGTKQDAAQAFVGSFAAALKARRAAWVPTTKGLKDRVSVALPHRIDTDGFFENHFSEILSKVVEGKEFFIQPDQDGLGTRAFLGLAGLEEILPATIVDLIQLAGYLEKTASWWYECYEFMTDDGALSHWNHARFVGRKLVPDSKMTAVAVPQEGGFTLVLAPKDSTSGLNMPDWFAETFIFMNAEVADLLDAGRDEVKAWVLDRFRISRFEASDLLPRAVRNIVQRLFSGRISLSADDLAEAWVFIRRAAATTRIITSVDFWEELGRFPLPLKKLEGAKYPSDALCPAFLTYWPDSWMKSSTCLVGVSGLRRIDMDFLGLLVRKSQLQESDWLNFLQKTGVSAVPRLLRYSRIVTRAEELQVKLAPIVRGEAAAFTGERQSDENKAVIQTLQEEPIWHSYFSSAADCDHASRRVLHSLVLIEGLGQCAQKASVEYNKQDPTWRERLWSLAKSVPVASANEFAQGSIFCYGGRGGHSFSHESYLNRQLQSYRWLPSTHGPASSPECFLRLRSKRLILTGVSSDELGDWLLPYVVAETIDDYGRLHSLGIEVLEDTSSASTAALTRALEVLGAKLSSGWGCDQILEQRGRWRLVRGAIQEIYRQLNQRDDMSTYDGNLAVACRSVKGIEFCQGPLYYAEPGSPIEEAFQGTLSLFDADRPFPNLFDKLRITRLVSGETIEEKVENLSECEPVEEFKDEIAEKLAPYLLAPMLARGEKGNQAELAIRRLRNRFRVMFSPQLRVTFTLSNTPAVQRTIDFPRFYIQSQIIGKDQHFALYIAKQGVSDISGLDGDALGEALIPVFLERSTEEIASFFPRIVARYQHVHGNSTDMEKFLYYQLHISREAIDLALIMVTGRLETGPSGIEPPPPPPPPLVIDALRNDDLLSTQDGSFDKAVKRHESLLHQKTSDIIRNLTRGQAGVNRGNQEEKGHQEPLTPIITREQQDRGLRGELEAKRRMTLPGGLAGLFLKEDVRHLKCGYDFLCMSGDREVRVEVKTFTPNGRIIVTSNEIKAACIYQEDYYLVGLQDDGGPEYGWRSYVILRPLNLLLTKGEIDLETTLRASAADIFPLSDGV